MRPAPIKFSDEVPEGEIVVVQRDVIKPSKAIAVSLETVCFASVGWEQAYGRHDIVACSSWPCLLDPCLDTLSKGRAEGEG